MFSSFGFDWCEEMLFLVTEAKDLPVGIFIFILALASAKVRCSFVLRVSNSFSKMYLGQVFEVTL